MSHMTSIRIAPNGRMVLPKAARAALGITEAGVLALTVDGDEVKLISMASSIKRAQEMYRKHVKNDRSSDDFLEERRQENAREEAAGR